MTNIHNHNPKARLEAIQNSDKISEQNKKDLKEFYHALRKGDKGKSRQVAYLSKAKVILEHEENDLRLKEATSLQIDEIDEQIDNSAYYSKGYSPETKKEYRKFLRIFFKWTEKDTVDKRADVPEKVRDIKASVSEDVKDRTDPSDLPTPDDIKLICQNMSLRWRSLILTHWDLGSRINETLRTRIGDYSKEDGKAYIYVRVNPEQSEEGAKSPRRKCRVKIAAPVIDRWLEEEHPKPEDDDAYLFCRTQKIDADDTTNKHAYHPASYSLLNKKLGELEEGLGLECDPKTHTIRKSRTTFMNTSLEMQESEIDKRIGHIAMSEVTREYTRLDDSDSNNAYGEGYGEENPEDNDVRDLVPLTCKDCGEVNSGHRDRCYECNGLLEIKELEEREKKVSEARELLWETLENKGMLDDIEEVVSTGGN